MKYLSSYTPGGSHQSPPSRGAWIEIAALVKPFVVSLVAPLAGGVD